MRSIEMGEEEEGEKLERRRESPEMETPVRNQITDTAVSKFEESPVFNFINSLSPLKTVKSLRISQRFNSFSFPSVASVFTSPQVSSTKAAAVLKKHHVPDPSSINSSSENENKVYNSDERKENYAVNTYECSKFAVESDQSGLDHMPCGRVQTECLFEGTLRSDDSLAQVPAVIRDDVENEEKPGGDWEKLISNAGDFLIFDSPSDTDAFRGTSLCKSLMPEFAFENTNELNNKHFVDPTEVEQCETEPPAQLVDNEPFPNLHRGMRRRCLVFEMGGVRKKKLEESSSSGPFMLSPYNSVAVSIDKQLNDSDCCIVPGIGLHLNALAKTSNNNGFGHGTHSTNVFISNGSHLSVGPGQDFADRSLPAASMERATDAVENGVPGTEGADQASGYVAIVDINQISPKKKRCKMENEGENEGCKRCNCKKSKCLKLYCECFAAGVYCVEPCSCQECFNKPIHEETVLATRKQIESRNPLAFAPKVIRSSESAPETRDDSSKTPASARHKRGCNCKKSGCLKKYCECYQEGVGCSINCRCEGCKNAFGRKDGSVPGAEAQLEEEEIETHEKSMVDKSLHENIFQNSVQDTGINCLSATPSRLARASIQLPFSSRELLRSSSLAIGSSSKLDENQISENTSFLLPHLELEKRSEAVEGGEMPKILQGNYSSLSLIKSSSPNRKRVSPPHTEFGRSPNRTTSRKLILQSIPSFPSLTPKY